MKRYNRQIEDAYVASRRQGNMMRSRPIERSSGQDRSNRYRDDWNVYPETHLPYGEEYQGEPDRTDRYGYERSTLYNSRMAHDMRDADIPEHDHYPDTYRSGINGYQSTLVGNDFERSPFDVPYTGSTPADQHNSTHRGKGPRHYKRSDQRIEEDLHQRLTDDPYVDASDLQFEVKSREITLSGHVKNRQEKRRAADLAESIPGVTNVENRIRVSE